MAHWQVYADTNELAPGTLLTFMGPSGVVQKGDTFALEYAINTRDSGSVLRREGGSADIVVAHKTYPLLLKDEYDNNPSNSKWVVQ